MIAKGNLHNSGTFLARYLLVGSQGTERAEVGEVRGFAVSDPRDALALVQLQSQGTHCRKPVFHVQVRLPEKERLTREQWAKVTDRIERKLGFDGQPRVVVFHQKGGGQHMHVAWSRIGDDLRAIDPGLFKVKLKEVCRELEREMGLQVVKNERDAGERTRPANRREYEESRRLKSDLKAIREGIRDCVEASPTAEAFTVALEKRGLVLARGDRRAYVIVDEKGGMHALSKRITGLTMKETRGRLAGWEKANLPSVEQARAIQREKNGQEVETMPIPDEEKREVFQREEEQKRAAIQQEEDRKQQAIQEEEDRKQKVIEEDQQKQATLQEEAQKEEENRRRSFKEQVDRLAQQAEEMEQQQRQLDAYRAELAHLAEEGRIEAERERAARETAQAREREIRNPHSRYGQALGEHYDIRDPYGSLARASMAEYGAFIRDRENLDRQIARTENPTERRALELRQRIEAADYMAVTSERIASQSETIVGRRNTDEAVKQRERAAEFRKEAGELREQYREVQTSRAREKMETREKATESPARVFGEPERKTGDQQKSPEKKENERGLMVEERPIGKPRGQSKQLDEFMKDVSLPSQQNERKYTPEEIKKDPAARKAHYAQIVAEQKRTGALDRMGEDMRAGRNLNADDVRKLRRDDLEGIRTNGDEHLRRLVQDRDQERRREQERER